MVDESAVAAGSEPDRGPMPPSEEEGLVGERGGSGDGLVFGTPFGSEAHVVLGMSETAWERFMEEGRGRPGWGGAPVTLEPRWHSHPALGITGHAHGKAEEARRAHSHRPVAEWDHSPVFIGASGPGVEGLAAGDGRRAPGELRQAAGVYLQAAAAAASSQEWAGRAPGYAARQAELHGDPELGERIAADGRAAGVDPVGYHFGRDTSGAVNLPPEGWPAGWDPSLWRPADDQVSNLEIAGAFIAAEVERLRGRETPDGLSSRDGG